MLFRRLYLKACPLLCRLFASSQEHRATVVGLLGALDPSQLAQLMPIAKEDAPIVERDADGKEAEHEEIIDAEGVVQVRRRVDRAVDAQQFCPFLAIAIEDVDHEELKDCAADRRVH